MSEKPTKQGCNKDFIDNQWKPGQSGNPGGRPKYKPISDKIREILESDYTADGESYAEHIAQEIIKELLDKAGNLKHGFNTALLKEILDRSEGKVTDTHRIEGEIPVSIVYKRVKNE